jgi:hypothetical protein
LKLTDEREFFVTDEQGKQIQQALARQQDFIMLPGNVVVKTKIIYSLLPGTDPVKLIEGQKRIADTRVATDEGMRRAREKLQAKLRSLKK